ncbi:serine/threonine protein kinase [bacterium]|nr:serine/threonine protein kinase [bacterium]
MKRIWLVGWLWGLMGAALAQQSGLDLKTDPPEAVLILDQHEVRPDHGHYTLTFNLFEGSAKISDPHTAVLRAPGYEDLALPPISWPEVQARTYSPGSGVLQLKPSSPAAYLHRYPALWLVLVGGGLVLAHLLLRQQRDAQLTRQSQENLAELTAGADVRDPMILSTLGRYQIVSRLGEGGMASVYRAVPVDKVDESEAVALKIIRPDQDSPQFKERFEREIRVSMKLDHPNVVRVVDWGEEKGIIYLVMELVQGRTLHSVVRGQVLPVDEAMTYVAGLVEALAYAHSKGIVHRDLKPENVMINRAGRIKLMDFGMARSREVKTVTAMGVVVGTAAYLAPEQCANGPHRDALTDRSDQYALAILIYEILTRQRPFESRDALAMITMHMTQPPPPIREFRPDLPEALEKVLLKMLKKNPDDRYPSVKEAGLDLLRATLSLSKVNQSAIAKLEAIPQPRASSDPTAELPAGF